MGTPRHWGRQPLGANPSLSTPGVRTLSGRKPLKSRVEVWQRKHGGSLPARRKDQHTRAHRAQEALAGGGAPPGTRREVSESGCASRTQFAHWEHKGPTLGTMEVPHTDVQPLSPRKGAGLR